MDVKEIGGEMPPLAFAKKGKREELEGTDFQKALQEAHSHLQESPAPSVSTGDVGEAEWLEPVTFPLLPLNLAAASPSPQWRGSLAPSGRCRTPRLWHPPGRGRARSGGPFRWHRR